MFSRFIHFVPCVRTAFLCKAEYILFIYILTNMCYFLCFSLCLFVCGNYHPNECAVVSHWCFDWHIFNDYWYWTPFLVLTDIYIFSLEKCIVKFLPSFKVVYLFLLLSCRNSLYILDINSISDIWFTNIFSHFVDLFHSVDNVF